jgi:hypothetical protein
LVILENFSRLAIGAAQELQAMRGGQLVLPGGRTGRAVNGNLEPARSKHDRRIALLVLS